jgi:hypothetical protein
MPSSTSSFERRVPLLPWRRLGLAVAVLTLAATGAWELRCRAWGYAPTLNDTPDLWAQRREALRPDSLVIIGDSRPLFDLDLDELEKGLGQRPLQLALPGSSAFPILADLAAEESFHGTIICSLVPVMFLAPGGPLMETSERALERYRTQTLAQRSGHHLSMLLEESIAFLKQEDLTLEGFLEQLPIPNRPGTGGPSLPPYFQTVDRERRMRMTDACARPGPLQTRIKEGWIPLFTPPPPPSDVPEAAFIDGMSQAIEGRFRDTASAVQRLRSHGGKIVFVRFPVSGELEKLEDRDTPRAGPWTRILEETGAPGIYFKDYPELSSFECPESSHLSAPDSVEFTKRLVPHLREVTNPAPTTRSAKL